MKRFITLVCLGIMIFVVPSVYAVPILELSSGGSLVQVKDGDPLDSNIAAGVVTYSGSIENFNINVTTGLTISGTSVWPHLDLNSVDVSSLSGGVLTIKFSENNYTAPYDVLMKIGGTTDGTVLYESYFSNSNDTLATTTLIGSLGPFGSAFSGTGAFGFSRITPYSLTEVVTVTHNAPGGSSFNAELRAVTEPGTMMLLGSGLVGLAGWGRKKFRK